MCGRFLNRIPAAETARIFGTRNAVPNYPARYNIAPTDPVMAVRLNPKTRERSLDLLRWGLVPHFVKDLASAAKNINARAETVDRTPSFRDAFQRRRCLIPASGFYEWQKHPAGRTPYAILPKDEPLFAFAGLWENWRDRSAENALWIRSCAIITTHANEILAPIHERMPAILPREAWPAWLGETEATADALKALLAPFPAPRLRLYPIGSRVNSVKNDDAGLIEPMQAEGGVRV